MLRAFLSVLALSSAMPAVADEGELLLGASAGLDVAWLSHPLLSGTGEAFDALAPTSAMPRARIEAHYCLTNDLELGLGVDVEANANVTTRGAFRGETGAIVTGGYVDVGVPLALAWKIDFGLPVTFLFDVEVGPGLAFWSGNALVNEAILDKQHRPQRLPVDLPDVWQPGADLTVNAVVLWRIGDGVSVSAGPYLGAGWYGGSDVHAGLVVTAVWIPPTLGP